MTPQAFSEALERLNASRQVEAAKLLGITQSRVSEYRNGKKIPAYVEASIQAHLLLSEENLNTIKQLRGIQ